MRRICRIIARSIVCFLIGKLMPFPWIFGAWPCFPLFWRLHVFKSKTDTKNRPPALESGLNLCQRRFYPCITGRNL